jgi:hypothetical protein
VFGGVGGEQEVMIELFRACEWVKGCKMAEVMDRRKDVARL